MKKILLTFSLSLFSFLLFAQSAKDEQAIKTQIEAFSISWNNHNFDDMKNYTTDDVEWVNVVGMWWKGRKEVQFAHQFYHNTMFKNVALEQKLATVRFVTKKVAVAHVVWYYGEFTTPDGSKRGNTDDIATLVYVKQNGKWLLSAGQNVPVDGMAKPFDPVKQMPKN